MMYWTRGEGFATDCSAKPQDTMVIGGRGGGGQIAMFWNKTKLCA